MNKEQLLLYAVTDRAWVGKYTLLEQIEQALEGGVSILPFVYPYARAYDCPGMLERAAACGGAIARYRNIYGAEHGSEGTQQGNGSRGWRGRDRRRLQAPDGVHRTVGPVLGRHRTPQIASGPLDSVHGIGAAGHDRAVLVGTRHRGAGRLMDGDEPEFPRSL